MAAAPPFKVYDSQGQYQAATKEVAAAACLMGLYGKGATIRYGHNITVWTQGLTGDATESYDAVAEHVGFVLAQYVSEHETELSVQYLYEPQSSELDSPTA